GRSPENQIVLASQTVSRVHAELDVQPGAVHLANLSSTAPALVDGVPAPAPSGAGPVPAPLPGSATPAGMQAVGVTPAGTPVAPAAAPAGDGAGAGAPVSPDSLVTVGT